jgi:deoxyribose-phosphate aldolase
MPTTTTLARLIGEAMQSWSEQKAASTPAPAHLTPAGLAALIDHTLLKPDASEAQVRRLCQEALHYHFASVCVNAGWVPRCAELLTGSEVKVCSVAGFPLGATLSEVKAFEAATAIRAGAHEVDMVLAIGRLKGGDYAAVYEDVEAVAIAAHEAGALLKVILETALLSDEEKVAGAVLAKTAGADFVKTSTGFGGGGATVADVRLLRQVVGPDLGVKASGGVRSAATALELVAAGATRIGASASVPIIEELAANPAMTAGSSAKKDLD